ncbi:NUDIX hydrolase [Gorillibacterium massiliense]|uniref:NUDIX hydrolase n=1 Tax=Gorillibacterium massiliense TaxID=1280390 RepID=UPI0006934E2F|nr:NUDIX hydrolase [Gorillibacterium massiliense]
MSTHGSFTIILSESGDKFLLVKRRDFPFWDLPGGRKEKHESDIECAIREVKEETGLEIRILNKIGQYERPFYYDIQNLFFGEITGGELINTGPETAELRWFIPKKLPMLMVPNRRMQINHFISGQKNLTVTINDSKLIFRISRTLKRRRKLT